MCPKILVTSCTWCLGTFADTFALFPASALRLTIEITFGADSIILALLPRRLLLLLLPNGPPFVHVCVCVCMGECVLPEPDCVRVCVCACDALDDGGPRLL